MKECYICYESLPLEFFHKDKTRVDGFRHYCKNCGKLTRKKLREDQKGKQNVYLKEYRIKNKVILKQKRQLNSEKLKKYALSYHHKRYKTDDAYKFKINVRNLIQKAFIYNDFIKTSKTIQILGCSFEEFRTYLEAKFEPWMTWENRGLYNGNSDYGWDIDHIIPLSSAKTMEDIIRLNHYTNFQPLCSHINRDIKRNTVKP